MTAYDDGRILADLLELLPHGGNCRGDCCDADNGFDCRAGYLTSLVDYVSTVAHVRHAEATIEISQRLERLLAAMPGDRFRTSTTGIPFVLIGTPELASVLLGADSDHFRSWCEVTDGGRLDQRRRLVQREGEAPA
jgi:hypothetical protein